MIENADFSVLKTLIDGFNYVAGQIPTDMVKPALGASGAIFGSLATIGYQKIKNKVTFNRAAKGNRISPEIKISLLQWEEDQEPMTGEKVYNLHSSTKSMDLRKVLPDEYKDELGKYIVAAAKEADENNPFIIDHIDTATKKFGDLFKTRKTKEAFARRIHEFIDEETKYIIQGEWGGGSVLQQAYEAGGKGMEGFYGVWVHQNSDDLQEIRLLLLPEKYLHEPLPDPSMVRVREGAKGGDGFYFDPTGQHSHIQRLKILHKAAEKLRNDSALRGTSWISLPVQKAPEIQASAQVQAQSQKQAPLVLTREQMVPAIN